MSRLPVAIWERLQSALADIGQRFSDDHFEAQFDAAIRSTNEQVDAAKQSLTLARARKIETTRKASASAAKHRELEAKAITALRSRKKAQARSVVVEIANIAAEREEWEAAAQKAIEEEKERLLEIELLEGQVKRLKYQLSVRRASTNLQRTQEALLKSGHREVEGEAPPSSHRSKKQETQAQIMARLEKIANKQSTKAQHKKGKNNE